MAAAAAAVTPAGRGGGAPATTSRFAAACGALSQYVKAAAEAERRPAVVPVRRPLPLMPGAYVDDDGLDLAAQPQPAAAPAPGQMMTIVYEGRVLVLDAVPADAAAGLLRIAAAAAGAEAAAGATNRGGQGQVSVVSAAAAAADLLLPVARKASLQRFMEKRKVRAVAARAEPYRRPDDACPCPDHLKLAL